MEVICPNRLLCPVLLENGVFAFHDFQFRLRVMIVVRFQMCLRNNSTRHSVSGEDVLDSHRFR